MNYLLQVDFPHEGPFKKAFTEAFTDLAKDIAKEEGLVWKIWTENEETKEGVECYKLKMTKKTQLVDGEEIENVVYYYIDKDGERVYDTDLMFQHFEELIEELHNERE